MADYKEETKAMDKLIVEIRKAGEIKHAPLSDGELQSIFSKNQDSIDVVKLEEKDLDKIKNIIQDLSKTNPTFYYTYMQKPLQEFWQTHLVELGKNAEQNLDAATEQRKEEADKGRFIKLGSGGNVADPGLRKADEIRERKGVGIGEKLYYYVWWIFDNEADYNKVAQNHAYPRDRGQLKIRYEEIGNKNIEEALAGSKKAGSVQGDFLGARGLARAGEIFTNIVENVQLKPGQVVALGMARAKRWDWRTFEWRGLTESKLMRFDVEKLLWKWAKYSTGGKKERSKDPSEVLNNELIKWYRTYNLEKEDRMTLKWHYSKKDAEMMQKIRDNLNDVVNKYNMREQPIDRGEFFAKGVLEDLDKVILAWKKEDNPELLDDLSKKTQIGLFKQIKDVVTAIGAAK